MGGHLQLTGETAITLFIVTVVLISIGIFGIFWVAAKYITKAHDKVVALLNDRVEGLSNARDGYKILSHKAIELAEKAVTKFPRLDTALVTDLHKLRKNEANITSARTLETKQPPETEPEDK